MGLFSEIENKTVTSPQWKDLPYKDEQLNAKTMVFLVKDSRSLTITFQMEDLDRTRYRGGTNVRSESHLRGGVVRYEVLYRENRRQRTGGEYLSLVQSRF